MVGMTPQATLKQRFCQDVANLVGEPRLLIVVREDSYGALETITSTDDIGTKITHYIGNYDENFRLRHNSKIKVVSYILA